MGRKHVAKKVEWGISPLGQVLYEKREDRCRIVRNVQTTRKQENGRWVFDYFPVDVVNLGYYRDAWLDLGRDMIRIDDDDHIDALLNSDSDVL